MTRQIVPSRECKACHGSGEVNDWVDYGSTRVAMPSVCGCVEEQLTEAEAESGDYEVVYNGWEGPDPDDIPLPEPWDDRGEALMIWDDFLEARYEEACEAGYGDW